MRGSARLTRIMAVTLATAATVLGGYQTAVAAPGDDGPKTRIIGGEDATETYAFMASMQTRDASDHNCGASLISPEWILTAAHCVEGDDPADWQFRIGTNTYNDGGEVVYPAEFITHPDYAADIAGADVALVRLESPAESTPIRIGSATPADESEIRLLGWGLQCPTRGCGEAPVDLQQLDTTVLPDADCEQAAADTGGTYDAARELCENTNEGTTAACYGDSGGPALAKEGEEYVLVGDTSRGFYASCLEGPGVYNDVTAHVDWINEVTGGIASIGNS